MKYYIFSLVGCVLTRLILCNLFNPNYYSYRVHRLERCREDMFFPLSVDFKDFKVVRQNNITVTFTGEILILKPVEINFRLSIHGLLCDGSKDRTCKHIFIKKFGFICKNLRASDQPWHAFLNPKFRCPIPPGSYSMGNATIDINALSYLPLFEGYWVLKVYGYTGSDVVLCVYSEMELLQTPESRKRRIS